LLNFLNSCIADSFICRQDVVRTTLSDGIFGWANEPLKSPRNPAPSEPASDLPDDLVLADRKPSGTDS
jgi:hypothetical protein